MSVTAATRCDPWEMALIHRLITRGFAQARDLVLSDPGPDRRPYVAEYVAFHLDGLDAHHSTEDENIWPLLHERAELSTALIDRMEGQHAGVHAAIETARRLLPAWAAAPAAEGSRALGDALATISERLGEHLSEEERDVVPLIAAHVGQDEWDRAGKAAFAKFSPQQRFTAMGELLSSATKDESDRMLGGLPPPVRFVWWLAGRRRYERFMARARG